MAWVGRVSIHIGGDECGPLCSRPETFASPVLKGHSTDETVSKAVSIFTNVGILFMSLMLQIHL